MTNSSDRAKELYRHAKAARISVEHEVTVDGIKGLHDLLGKKQRRDLTEFSFGPQPFEEYPEEFQGYAEEIIRDILIYSVPSNVIRETLFPGASHSMGRARDFIESRTLFKDEELDHLLKLYLEAHMNAASPSEDLEAVKRKAQAELRKVGPDDVATSIAFLIDSGMTRKDLVGELDRVRSILNDEEMKIRGRHHIFSLRDDEILDKIPEDDVFDSLGM